MADGSEAQDNNSPHGREAEERAGLGLLSRFLGAVFLMLLGGLLLLDRSLVRANHNQAELHAQSAALLTQSFVAAQVNTLERITGTVPLGGRARDSLSAHYEAERIMADIPGLRRLWIADGSGRIQLDVAERKSKRPIADSVVKQLQRMRPANGLGIQVIGSAPDESLLAFIRHAGPLDRDTNVVSGAIVGSDALRSVLERIDTDTRLTLTVVSGVDTLVHLGRVKGNQQALAGAQRIVRLPTGGTWGVTATHALTTRSLRWSLWILGVLGIIFLALGLLREQRRAIQAAGRSVELERLYSDVKRANQAKSEFLANVSHELRTPLNAIVGFVELLRDGFYGDLSPRQVPPVDRIAASATHLRHLVDQVLDIAKIAAGRLEVHAETIVLRPFVLNVASELESLVSEKGLTFSITVGASLPRVRTDPIHLRQILINLIGNAVKYTPAGTVSVRARLLSPSTDTSARLPNEQRVEDHTGKRLSARAPRTGTWVVLQVVDTGVGILATDLDRIFDEFEQVNAGPRGDSMQRGTGLGLAISRRLARLLGGEISVESEPGRGSTFTVWLPVNPADLIRDSVGAAPGNGNSASV